VTDEDYEAGYEYVLSSAHAAAAAALATAARGESPEGVEAGWEEHDDHDAFSEGASRALRDIALLEADDPGGGGDGGDDEDEDGPGPCPDCGSEPIAAMGGLHCPECGLLD
jgi:hypothetical protein